MIKLIKCKSKKNLILIGWNFNKNFLGKKNK